MDTDIRKLELRLLLRKIRSAPYELEQLLDEDFMEFGASGQRYNRSEILEHLANEQHDIEFTMTDFHARELAPGLMLATYRIVKHLRSEDRTVYSLRSSIWRLSPKNSDGWRMVFHQATPVPAP